MSTIQTKRKKSTGNANVTLVAAEPYYNLADKALYLGDADGTDTFEGKKHIAELSVSSDTARQLKLAIGEAKDNDVTLKVAHTDDTHAEGVEVSDKAITLYVDSYIKADVDNKIMTSTELQLAKLADNKSSLQVGYNESNSFKIALNHSTPESPNLEGVFWNDDDNILYITVSAYTKSEIDTKVATLSNSIADVSNNLKDNYYIKSEIDTKVTTLSDSITGVSTNLSTNYYDKDNSYNKDEVDSEIVSETAIKISASTSGNDKIAKLQVGTTTNNQCLFFVGQADDNKETSNHWTTSGSKVFLNLKPYYTKNEIDGMIDEGIAGKMSVVNGVLKFSNS